MKKFLECNYSYTKLLVCSLSNYRCCLTCCVYDGRDQAVFESHLKNLDIKKECCKILVVSMAIKFDGILFF